MYCVNYRLGVLLLELLQGEEFIMVSSGLGFVVDAPEVTGFVCLFNLL